MPPQHTIAADQISYADLYARWEQGNWRATEIDFNMSRGRLKLSCRKALAFYLLRQLQLDRPPDQSLATQPLELVNRAEMTDVLAAAQKPLGFPPLAHAGHQEFHHERT